jgi:hypothetical protein
MSFSDEKATIVERLIQQVQSESFILDAEKLLTPSILHTIPELRQSLLTSSWPLSERCFQARKVLQIL